MAYRKKAAQAETGIITAAKYQRRQTAADTVNLPPSPPFILKHHPERWGIIDGEWLPILGKMKLEPGLNGITHTGGEGPAREGLRQKGWKLLEPEVIGEDYVSVYPGRRGPVHLEKWVVLKKAGNRIIMKSDQEAYKAFLKRLIKDGHIAPLDEDVKEILREQKMSRIQRNLRAAEYDPAMKQRVQEDKELLKAMGGKEDV